MAEIIVRRGKKFCSFCRMEIKGKYTPICWFCNKPFSNYEEIIMKDYLDEEREKERYE